VKIKEKHKIPFVDYLGGFLIISSIMAGWLAGSLNTVAVAQQTTDPALFGGTLTSQLTIVRQNANTNTFLISDNNGELAQTITYGRPDDTVLVADVDGDRLDVVQEELIIRRGNHYLVDLDNNGGSPEVDFTFGNANDLVFFLDHNGDGREDFAIRRGNLYIIDTDLDGTSPYVFFRYGNNQDTILVADIDNDPKDELVIRRSNSYLIDGNNDGGSPEDTLIYGKPDDFIFIARGTRTDDLVIRRDNTFFADTDNDGGPADKVYSFGRPDDLIYLGDLDDKADTDIIIRRGNLFLIDGDDRGGPAEKEFRYGNAQDNLLLRGSPDIITDHNDPASSTTSP